MPNDYLNTSWVSWEILRMLLNNLVITEYFSKSWQKDFEKEFAVGSQIQVKFPWRPRTINTMTYTAQDIERIYTTVDLDQWIQIPFEWDDYEHAVKLERSKEELKENYFKPCGAAMAQEWDSLAAAFAYQNTGNVVGILGTDPTDMTTFHNARQILMEKACPPGKRSMNISSSAMNAIGAAIDTVFQPVSEITKAFKEGAIGRAAGFDFFESNSLWSHTAGTWDSTVTVTGASQSGSSLIITGTAGDTLKKGDKISIANVNRVNPGTRRLAGPKAVQSFTVTDDFELTGGSDTITISPAIYGPTSQYQNVDALPDNGAALTLWPGTSSPSGKVGTVGLALSTYAFMIVGARLYLPKSTEDAGQAQDPDSGLSIRKVSAWDPVRSVQVNRFDSLGGFGVGHQDSGAVCVAMK